MTDNEQNSYPETYKTAENLPCWALFDELNAISEEIERCRAAAGA